MFFFMIPETRREATGPIRLVEFQPPSYVLLYPIKRSTMVLHVHANENPTGSCLHMQPRPIDSCASIHSSLNPSPKMLCRIGGFTTDYVSF
jgi:hypothetical protein